MPVSRPFLSLIFLTIVALGSFGIGSYFAARRAAAADTRLDAISKELTALKRRAAREETGTSGQVAPPAASDRDALVRDIKRQLQAEMGLVPLELLKSRRESFVELYSYDNRGGSSYGTAGYLGDGYFITVKHGVIALDASGDDGREPRAITSIKLLYRGRAIRAKVVDAGDARAEVDPGDWAILKIRETIDLPPLKVDLRFGFDFADPIFRLGNDYSKGIILSTGYVGQRTANNLVTCLTDGHPGVSGGGVLDRRGHLVGIPIGRMQGDYRFSFILPLREDMFRKVRGVRQVELALTE
jgi:hypothetical protein